jgi:von Willebrand factor type D domain
MRNLNRFLLIHLFFILNACHPTTSDPAPFTPIPQPSTFYVGLVEGAGALGLVINDPIGKKEYAVFGERNAAGDLTRVTNILSSEPSTGRWVATDFDSRGRPTAIHTGAGQSVEFTRNTDGSYRTRAYDTATNRTLGTTETTNPNADLGESLEQLQEDAESLLAGDLTPLARSGILADMANLGTNAAGCIGGIGALGSPAGIVAGVLGAYNTYQACKSAYDALQNILNGRPTFGCVNATETRNSLLGGAVGSYLNSPSTSIIGIAADVASSVLPDVLNSGIQAAQSGICGNRARSHGDPHLTTADGLNYGFHGHGEFIASKSTTDNFEIQARQEDFYKTGNATINTALAIQTGTDVVCITLKPATLYINNKLQALNFTDLALKDGSKISRFETPGKATYLNIYSKYGDLVKVWFEGLNYLDYEIAMPESRKNKVFGILGNNDGDATNDLQIRNGLNITGTYTELYPKYADSWRIEQANSLFYYEAGKSTSSFTEKDFPRTKLNISPEKLTKAEAVCRAVGINSEPFLSNCTFDVAITGDNTFANSALIAQQNNSNSNKTILNNCSGTLDGKWGDINSSVYPLSLRGIIIEHKNGEGKVIFSPEGCPYKVGDIFWKNANYFNCTVDARKSNNGNYSTEFETMPIVFFPIQGQIDLGGGNVTFFARVK